MFKLLHNTAGFTLVENLVAIVVFTVGLLGVAGLTIVVINSNTFSSTLTIATILAHDKIEELRNTSYTNVNSGKETTLRNNINYTRIWNVVNNIPAAGMKTVDVTVIWQPRGRREHQVVLRTIISNI
jgi:type IV pilus assembly protein PilV